MKNDRKSMAVLCLYLITMLFVFVIFVTNLNFDSDNIEVEVTDKFDETFVPDTQIVYVPIYVESTEEVDNSETVDTEDIYIVKSYEGARRAYPLAKREPLVLRKRQQAMQEKHSGARGRKPAFAGD